MHTARPLKLALAALALAASPVTIGGAFAQTDDDAQPAPTLDPVALQALKSMGAYLRAIPRFELHTKAMLDTRVDDTDMKISLGYEGTYRVERPGAFYVSLKSDRQQREYFYDGKSFTVSVPRQHYFATVAAPPTIRATIDKVYDDFGISLPLADLFYWADDSSIEGITSAVRVGYAKIGTTETDQFVFRGPELDWQIWIARGPRPLPVRIMITTRTDPSRPSYTADLDWNTNPKFTPATFAFKADAKTKAIQMAAATPGEN
jgi:hypothetical protein